MPSKPGSKAIPRAEVLRRVLNGASLKSLCSGDRATYALVCKTLQRKPMLEGAPAGFFINSGSGIVLAQFSDADQGKTFRVSMVATDKSGLKATAETLVTQLQAAERTALLSVVFEGDAGRWALFPTEVTPTYSLVCLVRYGIN